MHSNVDIRQTWTRWKVRGLLSSLGRAHNRMLHVVTFSIDCVANDQLRRYAHFRLLSVVSERLAEELCRDRSLFRFRIADYTEQYIFKVRL